MNRTRQGVKNDNQTEITGYVVSTQGFESDHQAEVPSHSPNHQDLVNNGEIADAGSSWGSEF